MEESAAVVIYYHLARSLAAATFTIHHSGILHEPLLPHYRQRWIAEQLGFLRLPYVPTIIVQSRVDTIIAQLFTAHPSPSAFLLLSRNPSRFERVTRLSLAEFLAIYHELEAHIRQPYSFYSQPAHGRSTRRLHPVDQLLLWVWYSDGLDPDVLGIIFNDIHRTTADRVADHVTEAVNAVWVDEVHWPDAEERRSLYGFFSSCPTAVGVLDGTHCQIEVPVMEEGSFYSGYKNFHTQNWLICADALGFVTWFSGPFPGNSTDRTLFNNTPFAVDDCPLLSKDEVILVDGGFRGEGHIIHQFTQGELLSLTEEERERVASFNEDFLHNRSPIEHCIHRVKSRAQALTKRWPRTLDKQGYLFSAAVKLYNRCRRMRLNYRLHGEKELSTVQGM
jgi:hypothetical protein